MRAWLILIGWIIPTAVPAITQQVPPADLVPSLTAPAMLVNAPTTLRVTLSNQGGAIRESNEANNLIVPRVTIHRAPDLRPAFMSSSFRNESSEYVCKYRDTTLTFVVEQRENYVSTRNVNIRISTPNLDVKRVSATVRDAASRDMGSQGFICTWSNNTRSVSCLNGALGPRARVSIQAVVRGTLFAPSGNSPVIVSADPERRINEWSETNNTATYVVRIQ